jgi:GxxExxY protein
MVRETVGGTSLTAMRRKDLLEEALTRSVIGGFFEVYTTLKFGLFEGLYAKALEWELTSRGHRVTREFGVRVSYKGCDLGLQRLDLVVDETLVVEIKSTQDLHKAAVRQVYNYLRVSNLEIGLLLHFGPDPRFYRVYAPNHRTRDR